MTDTTNAERNIRGLAQSARLLRNLARITDEAALDAIAHATIQQATAFRNGTGPYRDPAVRDRAAELMEGLERVAREILSGDVSREPIGNVRAYALNLINEQEKP